jgi:hypothetical protein
VGADVPVRVNGDDIVFRAPPEVADHWASTVGALGLELCPGKTLVDSRFFSLNSTFFRGHRSGRVDRVPVLRPSCLSRQVETPHALGPACRTFCRGWRGRARVEAEALYLRWRAGLIARSGRSVLRDLRAPVCGEALAKSGLARREAWYLSVRECPLPFDQARMKASSVPEGWVRAPAPRGRAARRAVRVRSEEFWQTLLDDAWARDPVPVKVLARDTWRAAEGSGYEESWRWWRRHHRQSGRPRFGVSGKYLRGRFHVSVASVYSYRPATGVRKVWVRRTQNEGALRTAGMNFVLAR